MFEFEQDIVDTLLNEDEDFKRTHEKYIELKQQVKDANQGANVLDELSIESLKKEKLLLKDRMAVTITEYRQAHA